MKTAHYTEEKSSLTVATAVPGSSPSSVAEEEPGERRSVLLESSGRLAVPGKAPRSHTRLSHWDFKKEVYFCFVMKQPLCYLEGG